MKALFCVMLLCTSILFSPDVFASKVLFIGNSFIGFARTTLENFARANPNANDSFMFEFVGGSNLEAHSSRESTLRTLQCNRFDYVVLQDHSLRTLVNLSSFRFGVERFSELVRATGAKPILFETWARGQQGGFIFYPNNQTVISNAYHQAGKDFGAKVMHVGDIWSALFNSNRNFFFSLYQDDLIHQTPLGSYAIATAFYNVISGSDLSWAPTLGLSATSRLNIRGLSRGLNLPLIPHVNLRSDALCEVEQDDLIRERCGCSSVKLGLDITPILNILLE